MAEKNFVSPARLKRFLNNLRGQILNTREEIEANTSENMFAGAMALKEVNNSLGGLSFGTDGDGNPGYYRADGSLVPFSSLSDKVLSAATEILLTYKNTLTTSEEYTITEDGYYLVNFGNRFGSTGAGTATGNLYVNNEIACELNFTSTGNNSVQNTAIIHRFISGDIIKFSMKNVNNYDAKLLMSLYKL